MIAPLVLGGLVGAGKAIAGFMGGKAKARDERNRLDSEKRQREKQQKAQINNSSASGAGSVDVNSVDMSYLDRADAPDSSFVQDPSFFGTVFSGIGQAYDSYQRYR